MTELKNDYELKEVTAERWSRCVAHVIKEEGMCHLDNMIDDIFDRFIIKLTNNASDSNNFRD